METHEAHRYRIQALQPWCWSRRRVLAVFSTRMGRYPRPITRRALWTPPFYRVPPTQRVLYCDRSWCSAIRQHCAVLTLRMGESVCVMLFFPFHYY